MAWKVCADHSNALYQYATSGGQYHWVSEFAPLRVQKYLSYLTGWLCIAGWQGGITGIGMLVATVIQGLITLNNDNYVAQSWHGTLLTIGIVAFCVLFNTYGARQLPVVEGTLAVLHFGGMFVIIIILRYVSFPRNSDSYLYDYLEALRLHHRGRNLCERFRQRLTLLFL